jgi:hypothetical protein
VLLVAVMAGSALAFSLGVRFAPQSSCGGNHVTYGSNCPGKKHHHIRHIHVKGLGKLRHPHGHLRLSITNHNSVTVTIKLVLVVETPSGQIRRITRTFTLRPGKTFKLNRPTGLANISAAKLTLKVSDSSGDVVTISQHFGRIVKHTHARHSHGKHTPAKHH